MIRRSQSNGGEFRWGICEVEPACLDALPNQLQLLTVNSIADLGEMQAYFQAYWAQTLK